MKYNHIFFSPHLDDAVLSCGGLIAGLKNKSSTLVVSIFSDVGQGTTSEFGEMFINTCGYKNGFSLIRERKIEEKRAAEKLGYDFLFLDFPDAFFRFERKIFSKKYFYDSRKTLFGKLDEKDKLIIAVIKKRLKDIIKKIFTKDGRLYFPLTVGNHIDHQIINKIGYSFLLEKFVSNKRTYFYEDFPYIARATDRDRLRNGLQEKGLKLKKELISKKNLQLKYESILAYQSQIECLFESKDKFMKLFLSFYQKPYENYWHFA